MKFIEDNPISLFQCFCSITSICFLHNSTIHNSESKLWFYNEPKNEL